MMLPALDATKVAETQTCIHCLSAQSYWGAVGCYNFQHGEEMCSGGCQTHGDCDACEFCGSLSCTDLCECDICHQCEHLESECVCCSECGSYACEPCGGCDEQECQCTCDYDSGYYGGCNTRFGTIKVAPWAERGVNVDRSSRSHRSAASTWGIDSSIDLCQSQADFYLLEALASGVVAGFGMTREDPYLRLLASEAASLKADLVARLDRTFRGYVDMIIGGELRHHRAAQDSSTLRGDRSDAWVEWHAIRAAGGTAVLADAVVLFEDFGSSSYGGSAWATIAKVLLARETGQISPATFVDRVWSLQHNGGSLFDKMHWSRSNRRHWGLTELNEILLPAHGARVTPWSLLLAVASDEVRELFAEVWRQANRLRVALGERAVPAPRGAVPMTKDYWGGDQVDYTAIYELCQA